jgi:hypothetical protein
VISNKDETEQVEHETKIARSEARTATLDSSSLSTVKKEPTPLKSDVNWQSEMDSVE